MIPGILLLEKIVVFAIDIFIRNRQRNEELKRNFDMFFKRSGDDSKISADMHEQNEAFKKENPWSKKSELKS